MKSFKNVKLVFHLDSELWKEVLRRYKATRKTPARQAMEALAKELDLDVRYIRGALPKENENA